MAFGLPPKHVAELNISSQKKALVLLHDSFIQLGWKISYIGLNGIIGYTRFSFSSKGEEISIRFDHEKVIIKSQCVGAQLWDWGKNRKNIDDLVSVCKYLGEKTTDEEISAKYEELELQTLNQEDELNSKPQKSNNEIVNAFSFFIPRKGYFITPLLVNINILVFLLMALSGVNIFHPDNQNMINWGANFKPVTLEGQWWRLFSSCFLHFGIFHLLMNMYALIYIGLLLEPHLGRLRFLSAYLLTGLCASLTSLWCHNLVISAGASGAIFGLYGIFGSLLTTNIIEKNARRALLISIGIFVGYNLLNGLKAGIDNAAHVGGLLSGLLTGYAFYPSLKLYSDSKTKLLSVSFLSSLVLLTSLIIYSYLPNQTSTNYSHRDLRTYQKNMQHFANLEANALKIYGKLKNFNSKEAILIEIKNKSLVYLNESVVLIQEADKLKLPERLHVRNKKLLNYCYLRIQSMELLYRAIAENTDKYKPDIDELNIKIQNSINELKGQNKTAKDQ